MNITLEQSLASAVRFVLDHDIEDTKAYFDEIPESFYVPSVYFPVPFVRSEKVTLRSCCNIMSFEAWFMARTDWDAQIRASKIRDRIMLNGLTVPMVADDGQKTGKTFRVGKPETKRIDEGIVSLTLPVKDYFYGVVDYEMIQKFYIKIKKKYEWRG